MDLKLTTPYPPATLAGGAYSGGSATMVAEKTDTAFSGSLSHALGAMTSSVQEVRTQLSSGMGLADKAALQSTFSSLSALLGQFQQLLEPALASNVSNSGSGTSAAPKSGSILAGEEGAPSLERAAPSHLENLQIGNPTEKWVLAALNKSIAQARANGYDPEKSHAVNTLRGYFSSDAQAKSHAIHSIDRTMLAANGAYETFDDGVHTIAGAPPEGMDTSMPTFKTTFDKDWSRPSLYDMINSSLGWPGEVPGARNKPVNFADPSNRDGALNRKLNDVEIEAFQTGRLTPELQSLVDRYRSATT